MRRKKRAITPLELEIMMVLWQEGPSSVHQVQEQLAGGLAYTTVQTMLNVLVRKGRVRRTLVDRAYRYRAAITRQKALAQSLKDVVQRLFGGSAEALVMSLVETRQLSPDALRRLHELVEEDRDA